MQIIRTSAVDYSQEACSSRPYGTLGQSQSCWPVLRRRTACWRLMRGKVLVDIEATGLKTLANYLVCHVLLGTFWLSGQKRCNSLARQNPANFPRACTPQLRQDIGILSAKATRVEVNRPVIPFKPPHATECLFRRREQGESEENNA